MLNCFIKILMYAALIIPAAANSVQSYNIDYKSYVGMEMWRNFSFAMPPDKYLHAPQNADVIIYETDANGISTNCHSKIVYGCANISTIREFSSKRVKYPCYKSGVPSVCYKILRTGIETKKTIAKIFIPKEGETIMRITFAKADMNAILMHEIAHVNGWPHDHPRQ